MIKKNIRIWLKKAGFLVLIGMFFCSFVLAECEVVEESAFLSMGFEDLFNTINPELDDYSLGKSSIMFYYSINVVSRKANLTYCSETKTLLYDLSFEVLNECLNDNTSSECVNLLIDNDEPFNYIVNNELVNVNPINYLLRKDVMEEIDYMQRLQRQAQYNNFLEQIMMITPEIPNNINIIQEWVQPLGAHDCYPMGSVVSYNNNTWTNIINCNVWQPGVYGWEQETNNSFTPGNVYPDWTQPQGAHDCYGIGDIVWHNDQLWINTQYPCNVWEPGVFGWELYEE